MNGRTVLLLLVIAFLERASYYVTRSSLSRYLADTETGGLGLPPARAHELLEALGGWITYAPAAGALIACFVSLRLLLLLGCGIGMIAAASITWTSVVEIPLGLMVVGHGLFLPALYLLVAQQFSARDADKRDAAFALVLLAVNLGAFSAAMIAAWCISQFWWETAFIVSALLGLASLATAAFVRSPPTPDVRPKEASVSGAMILAGCLVLGLLTLAFPDSDTGTANEPPTGLFVSLYPPLTMLLFLVIAAVLWSRRARRCALPDVAGKVGLAASALTLALLFSALGNEPGILPIAESVCFGFYDAWVTPVAIALAATLFGGKKAALGLCAWLLVEPLAMAWTWTIAGESYPGPWTGAAGALVVVGAIIVLRVRPRG